MITVTKRILQSEKTSKQQNIAIIVVLSDYANNATCCNSFFVNLGNTINARRGMNGK
jgi:hypothetical protein